MPANEDVGVVDRVVGDVPVVLVGDEEDQYEFATASLPEGVGEGSWLRVRVLVSSCSAGTNVVKGKQRRPVSRTGSGRFARGGADDSHE